MSDILNKTCPIILSEEYTEPVANNLKAHLPITYAGRQYAVNINGVAVPDSLVRVRPRAIYVVIVSLIGQEQAQVLVARPLYFY